MYITALLASWQCSFCLFLNSLRVSEFVFVLTCLTSKNILSSDAVECGKPQIWSVNHKVFQTRSYLSQRGPTTFDLRAILHKRAPQTTRAPLPTKWCIKQQIHNIKTKKGKISKGFIEIITKEQIAISYKSLSVGCLWSRLLWNYRSIINTSFSGASRRLSSSVSSVIRFLFLDLTSFIVENVLSHTYVFPNIECIFSAKSLSLANLSLLTNFQKLSSL